MQSTQIQVMQLDKCLCRDAYRSISDIEYKDAFYWGSDQSLREPSPINQMLHNMLTSSFHNIFARESVHGEGTEQVVRRKHQ